MTFFSHRPFSCFINLSFSLRVARSVAAIDKGGQNPYISPISQYYHYSFFPEGGQTPLPTSMGAMEGLAPPGSATDDAQVYDDAFGHVFRRDVPVIHSVLGICRVSRYSVLLGK